MFSKGDYSSVMGGRGEEIFSSQREGSGLLGCVSFCRMRK